MKNPVIWYVAFSPKKKTHWWSRKFGHVSVFGWTNETWIGLDLQRNEVDVRAFFTHDDTSDYISYMLTHFTVLKFGYALPVSKTFFQPMTCVSFVKHVLGVNSCALLPDSLFRILLRKYDAEIIDAAQSPPGDGSTEANADSSGGFQSEVDTD